MIAMSDHRDPQHKSRPPTTVRAESSADEARAVDTVVVHEQGHWAVDIVVVFDDGVVRKRIATHRTRRRADLAADLIKRAAERDLKGPRNG